MVPQHGSFVSNVVLKAKHISVLPELLLNHRTSRSSSFATFLFGSAGQHQTCPRALSFLAKLSTCLWRWLEHWTFGALSPQVSRMLIRVSHLSGCPRHLDWNIKMKPDPQMWATDGLTESDSSAQNSGHWDRWCSRSWKYCVGSLHGTAFEWAAQLKLRCRDCNSAS